MISEDLRPGINITSELTITCKNDYNIIELHANVLNILESERKRKLLQLTEKLATLKEKISSEYINRMKSLSIEISNIEREILEIQSSEKIKSFIEETKELIEKYTLLKPLKIKKVFGKKHIEENETLMQKKFRFSLLDKYFLITDRYINLNVIWLFPDIFMCDNCSFDITKISENYDEVEIYCPNCGLEIHNFKNFHSEDSGSEYEDLFNFIKRIDHYEGKEKIKIPDALYKSLDVYFKEIGIPSGSEIKSFVNKVNGRRNEVFNKNGFSVTLSRNDMRKALNKIGFQDYYKNVNLICHQYWDWDLPNVDDLRDTLIDHYKKTEAVLKQIKNKNKKATINTDWRLENHLKILGYKYEKDDFKHIDTRNILEYYDTVWEQMCLKSGDPDIKYMKTIS